jgi:hypothetical protein
MSTLLIPIESRAHPVTATEAETPLASFTGVSKLPNGALVWAELIRTWITCGEFVTPPAVTITVPLDPEVPLICNVAFPTPDVGDTVILDWLEVAVHLGDHPTPAKVKLTD